MKSITWLSLVRIGIGILLSLLLSCRPHHQPPSPLPSTVKSSETKDLQYNTYSFKQSVVHTLLIPASSHFRVTPATSQPVSSLERFAQKYHAIAAINGGFFDPENQKSTSYIMRQEVLVADPRQNERLINNPKLVPYLQKILNRTEFRRYRCDQTMRYDIALHSEPPPPGCRVADVLGGGPRLLPKLALFEEGFVNFVKGEVVRDPLGSNQPNARSAIGITRDGDLLLVMVAQNPDAPTTSGMSLPALAAFMKAKGVDKAMNLDGGSSSCFYYKGKTVYGKVDEEGNQAKRELLSVLLIQPQ